MTNLSIDFANLLNDEQLAAVQADPGPSLVLAGAGSGKTRTLTYRVAWLVQEKGVHPDGILLVTFTNKAANEMIQRVQQLSHLPRKPRWSGTFHSIGARLLREFGHLAGLKPNFTILDDGDSESLLADVVKRHDKAFLKEKSHPKPRVILGMISYARNTGADFEEMVHDRFPYDKRAQGALCTFAKLYGEAKSEQQVTDYDDLLVLTRDILRDHRDARERLEMRFPWILVDEYQDTNVIQAEIIDLIGGHHNIMAVGDDAQCIYTWRGAEFANIRGFPERHPNTRIYKILTNYRSTPQILDFANAVLSSQPVGSGYAKELIPWRGDGETPVVVPTADTMVQARLVATRIRNHYDEGHGLGEIAVLYRAHYQALDLQLELTKQGIPFVITSGVKFFEQAHVRDFVAQLRVISNPGDQPAFQRLFQLLPKVGPASVTKVIDQAIALRDLSPDRTSSDPIGMIRALADERTVARVPKAARGEYNALMATLLELDEAHNRRHPPAKPTELVEIALDGWYRDYMRNIYPDWETRQDDLDSLVEFGGRYETLIELLAQITLLNSETTQKSIETDKDVVRLSTIHQAKGLEFPVVMLIGCAEDLFPLRRVVETGDIEEERRLFYVAVTRARDHLMLTYPMEQRGRGGYMPLGPSRFLREIPPNRYEKISFHHRW